MFILYLKKHPLCVCLSECRLNKGMGVMRNKFTSIDFSFGDAAKALGKGTVQ